MGKKINSYWVSVCKPEGKRHLESVGEVGNTILKKILKKQGWRTWTGFIWFRMVSYCKCEY